MRRSLVSFVCVLSMAAAVPASGQVTYSVVESFGAAAGSTHAPVLVLGADGDLYGVIDRGGANSRGFAFKLDGGGTLTVLHDFTLAEDRPTGLMQASDGHLYGTTYAGGATLHGTAFRLTTAGVYTTLYEFNSATSATRPRGSMIEGSDGWLYGTLAEGGGWVSDGGGAFKISTGGSFVSLHAYATSHSPRGALVEATDGHFYGVTHRGGAADKGTLFRMTPAGVVTEIHSFSGPDGQNPQAGLIEGSDGRLYGTAYAGGAFSQGTVFSADTSGLVTTLHSFSGSESGPRAALLEASDGQLYGTTEGVGFGTACTTGNLGGLFRIAPSGADYESLHWFGCTGDGRRPATRLVEGPQHTLHGMTTFGGNAGGGGTVYRLTVTQPFVITSPAGGSTFALGDAVTVEWTGGNAGTPVDVSLIDVDNWTVAAMVGWGIPNDGIEAWTLPSSHPLPGPCSRTYQFYVQDINQERWTYGPTFTVVCEVTVAIDIKPGSFPNSINPRQRGVVPVAILTGPEFDAATVDPATVRFGPSAAAPAHASLEDVDGDGDLDLILHFRTQETGIACGHSAAGLTGQTYTGTPIKGTDSIKTPGCGG